MGKFAVLLFLSSMLIAPWSWAKKPPRAKAEAHAGAQLNNGIVTSEQAEFGVMATIRGKTSFVRFYDKSLDKVCYASLLHKTDQIQAISCVDGKK